MQRLVGLCEAAGKPFRTVPPVQELLAGQVAVNQLRPVSLADLLGRDPVTLDWEAIRRGLTDKVVLVTGAGGSIGSELCRQLYRCGPRRLILVDQGEFNLYQIETELTEAAASASPVGPDPLPPSPLAGEGWGEGERLSRYLLDITAADKVDALFARLRPDIVFHAAAYKHVPLLEDQLAAALHNNVLGTQVMAEAAARWGCERFVLISTDKAVNPTNVMGATKRCAELICQDLGRRSACRFLIVRFGNVLGSAGSVVPRFQRQIERGGPVTVTHPEVERFFMTIPEACQLIMQAAAIGAGWRDFRPGHGRAGEDPLSGGADDPSVRPGAGAGYPYRVHGIAPGGRSCTRSYSTTPRLMRRRPTPRSTSPGRRRPWMLPAWRRS
jgi:FlaA1/EpsC-like NDP-sugar epimerase